MYNWIIRILSIEKGYVAIKVKASDKQSAIKKGFDKFNQKGLSYANKFDCTLCR